MQKDLTQYISNINDSIRRLELLKNQAISMRDDIIISQDGRKYDISSNSLYSETLPLEK